MLTITLQRVTVVRIKNRMEPLQHEDQQSTTHLVANKPIRKDTSKTRITGYRDLSINLKLEGERSQELCLHAHVCEVQLILIEFARIKSNAGHEHYVNWRNCRGE